MTIHVCYVFRQQLWIRDRTEPLRNGPLFSQSQLILSARDRTWMQIRVRISLGTTVQLGESRQNKLHQNRLRDQFEAIGSLSEDLDATLECKEVAVAETA